MSDLVNIPRKLFDETMAQAAACVSNKKRDHVQFGAFDNIDGERLLEALAETVTTLRAAARPGPGGCACLAAVTAERDEAIEALRALVLIWGPTGNDFEDFELQAEAFHRETGWMRAGKDMSAAFGGEADHDKRRARYREWMETKVATARAILSKHKKVTP